MIDDFVGISDLSQGLAFVTLLPTRFLAGPFAQTDNFSTSGPNSWAR